jgi:glutamate-ammonia-ligase adenylyltransferase
MISEMETGNIQRVIAVTPDLQLREQIQRRIVLELDRLRQPARAIERLVRFVERSRAPNTLLSQWDRSPGLLGTLLQALDVDSPAVEWLIDDPDSFDSIQLSAGRAPSALEIQDRLLTEVRCLDDIDQVRSSLKRFRRREWLRVVFGIELQGMSGAWAQQQLTWINDAILVAAFSFSFNLLHTLEQKPQASGPSIPIAVLAHGSYGSGDTDFLSECSLICISSGGTGEIDSRMERFCDILESFDPERFHVHFPLHRRLVGEQDRRPLDMQRWIEWAQVQGDAELGAALMQIRLVAGNPSIGYTFLQQIESLFLDRYRSRSEQASLASFLRKRDREERAMAQIAIIQHRIESILFHLQWIHGAYLPEPRTGNMASRIESLARHGCISDAEYGLLVHAHDLARDCKLKLQIQAGCAPSDSWPETTSTLDMLRNENIKLRALSDQFRETSLADEGTGSEEADLVFDPNPDPIWAAEILARYGFCDIVRAVALLRDLGEEDFRVLSTRRCRYFLSVIAPKLLQRIGQTPSPDRTLENLADTCRSIGAKGVLWELFSLHQPSMDLYIRLCGTSPYLIGILTSNPGMVDELVDSLLLKRLPSENHLSRLLDELCRGAQEIDAIVRSFKNAMHLSIGVRDILGKESISETHRTLASVADVCLQQWIEFHYNALVQRYGEPTCPFSVLALGKLGNREPNYHSDVTILLLYLGSGTTRPIGPVRHPQTIRNDLFFQQLAQRISQGVNRLTRHGRLFELRNWNFAQEPTANLAWTIDQFESAFLNGQGDALARMELLSARPIAGDPSFQASTQQAVQRILTTRPWAKEDSLAALAHRRDLESSASPRNLKRGRGGTMDIEMIAKILSLQFAYEHSDLVAPGTIDSIERLRRIDAISAQDALRLKDAYNYLRGVESGLRLMNTKARHDLPEDPIDLARLAFGLHVPDAEQLMEACEHYRNEARELLVRYVGDPNA